MYFQVDLSLFVRAYKNLGNYFQNDADSAHVNVCLFTTKRLWRNRRSSHTEEFFNLTSESFYLSCPSSIARGIFNQSLS